MGTIFFHHSCPKKTKTKTRTKTKKFRAICRTEWYGWDWLSLVIGLLRARSVPIKIFLKTRRFAGGLLMAMIRQVSSCPWLREWVRARVRKLKFPWGWIKSLYCIFGYICGVKPASKIVTTFEFNIKSHTDHPKIFCLIPYGARYFLKGFGQIFHIFWLLCYYMVWPYKVLSKEK